MNQLQVAFISRAVIPTPKMIRDQARTMPDKRYRCLVTLIRSDRPRYWNFICHNCGSKVVELQNLEVLTIDDFYDPQNLNNTGIGRHCKGKTQDGFNCPYTYFFNVR